VAKKGGFLSFDLIIKDQNFLWFFIARSLWLAGAQGCFLSRVRFGSLGLRAVFYQARALAR